jgi:hypothetical protein
MWILLLTMIVTLMRRLWWPLAWPSNLPLTPHLPNSHPGRQPFDRHPPAASALPQIRWAAGSHTLPISSRPWHGHQVCYAPVDSGPWRSLSLNLSTAIFGSVGACGLTPAQLLGQTPRRPKSSPNRLWIGWSSNTEQKSGASSPGTGAIGAATDSMFSHRLLSVVWAAAARELNHTVRSWLAVHLASATVNRRDHWRPACLGRRAGIDSSTAGMSPISVLAR